MTTMRAEARGGAGALPIAGGDVGALASKRYSADRKMAVVARVLRGEALGFDRTRSQCPVAKLTTWRERRLKARRRLLRNANGMTATMKSPG